MTDRIGRSYRAKPGRKPDVPEGTSLSDGQCSRLSVRISLEERPLVEAVARENGLALSALIRLAVTSLVEDYREGSVRIFARRRMEAASILRQEGMF
jgi:hypothetical protein